MDFLIALAALVDRLDPGVTRFLDHFRDGRVPLRLAVAIVASALVLLGLLMVWGAVAWWRIRRLRRLVRSHDTQAAFARDFRRIDRALSASILAAAWTEYRACLKTTEDRVLYPRRPHEYLGLDAIDSRSFPARFFAASHGYFIGVGLLLTFVGLVAALKFAAAGVASPDIAVAKEALNSLLSAASFKFMTSIAGLGSSLLLSVAARSVTYTIEGEALGLAGDLERVMEPIVTECLAYDQLACVREQSEELKKLGASVTAMGMTSGSAQSEGGAPATGESDRLERLLAGFLTEMRGSAGVEMKELAAKLSEVGEAIGRTHHHIASSGDLFAEQLSHAASRLLDAATAIQHGMEGRAEGIGTEIDALAQIFALSEAGIAAAAKEAARDMAQSFRGVGAEIARGVVAAADRLGGAIGGLDAFNARLEPQIASMQQIGVSLDGARQALDRSAETWTRSAAPIVASVEASRQVAAELAQLADRVVTAQRDMTAMAAAMARLSETTVSVWDQYRGRFEKVDDDLQAVFLQLQGGTRAFGQEVMEFVGKLDASLSGSMQALSIGTEELREVAELLVVGVQAKAA